MSVIQHETGLVKSDLAGLIIAGGLSQRFGSPKYKAQFLGKNLYVHVAERLSPIVSVLALNLPKDDGINEEYKILYEEDSDMNLGPLAAVYTGLKWAKAENKKWLLTMPVDVPWFPKDILRQFCKNNDGQGVYARSGGNPHWLCALWPVSEIEKFQHSYKEGIRAVYKMHKVLNVKACDFPAQPHDPFFNINSVTDLKAAENMFP